MSYVQFDHSYKEEERRYIYRSMTHFSRREMQKEWVLPTDEKPTIPIYGTQDVNGPWAWLTGSEALTKQTSILKIDRGAHVPPAWTYEHRIFHIFEGWGGYIWNGQAAIFRAPCLLVVRSRDVLSLSVADPVLGCVVSMPAAAEIIKEPTAQEVGQMLSRMRQESQ